MKNKLGFEVPKELEEIASKDPTILHKVNYCYEPRQYLKCLKCLNRDSYYDICKYSGYECRNVRVCSSFKPIPERPAVNSKVTVNDNSTQTIQN